MSWAQSSSSKQFQELNKSYFGAGGYIFPYSCEVTVLNHLCNSLFLALKFCNSKSERDALLEMSLCNIQLDLRLQIIIFFYPALYLHTHAQNIVIHFSVKQRFSGTKGILDWIILQVLLGVFGGEKGECLSCAVYCPSLPTRVSVASSLLTSQVVTTKNVFRLC